MNAIEALLAEPIFQALGGTLVHFVWQGAVVAALYATVNVFLRRCSASIRYGVACGALAMMLAAALATLFVMSRDSMRSSDDEAGLKPVTATAETIARADLKMRARQAQAALRSVASDRPSESLPSALLASLKEWVRGRFASFLPWLVAAWFAGVLLLSIRFLGGLIAAERLKHKEANPLLEQWQEKLSTLAGQLRVSRPVRLCESALVEVPTVIGWVRPVILVPATALTGLSAQQLEAILAHELAHIRRYDYFINLLQTAVETLLFYHPAVWWVSGQIRQEREHCCDDLAVAACGSVLVYARALAELEQLRSVAPQLAVAANGGSLLRRIQRLVGSPARRSHRFESGLAGVIALATVLIILAGAETTILSRSTPGDAAQSPHTQSPEAGDALAGAKPSRGEVSGQKPSGKSQDKLMRGELDEPGNTTPGGRAVQTEEKDHSVDEAGQGEESGDYQGFARALKDLGYTGLSADDLMGLKRQAAAPEFIREMNALMSQRLSVNQLTAFRIHGVTPKFVNELRSLGLADLSADQLVAFRIHGVTPEYISDLNRAGYADLSADSLTAFRVYGVTPAFIQQMKDLGFDRIPGGQLTALRVHGVTPGFVRAMRGFIRGNVSIDDLTGLRIHGVTPEFIRELDALGYSNLSAGQLMGLRIHGVTPGFIQAVRALGYKPTPDELTSMRIHGVTPDFMEAVRSRGFNDVTLAQIIELRRLNGMPGPRKR
ncbi:MAG TPA: M56 family metallopeptidase [Blastocatellia bacterium]|nr:M56 family metallopeptidase [Blastocatellia bacterium]